MALLHLTAVFLLGQGKQKRPFFIHLIFSATKRVFTNGYLHYWLIYWMQGDVYTFLSNCPKPKNIQFAAAENKGNQQLNMLLQPDNLSIFFLRQIIQNKELFVK